MSVGDPAETILSRPRSDRIDGTGTGLREDPGRLGLPTEVTAATRALATSTAALVGFVLPVLMVIANKSAPATLGAAALTAHAAALLGGQSRDLGLRYRALASSPLTLLTLAVVALAVASFGWTVDPHLTARGLVEGLPELAFALGLAAAWPLVASPGDRRWLVGGVAVAGFLILFEHVAGMPIHALVRARGEAWDLKRSAVPPLLLLWPAAAMLWRQGRFASIAALAAAVTTGIVAAHSGAPGAALAVGAGVFALALAAPRPTLGLTGIALAVLILGAPWTGSILTRALPPDARMELREEHAEHRLAIWTAFERRGFDRPWLGHGFDASFAVAEAARPDGSPAPADSARIVGFHPHDVLLQTWIEFGTLGLGAAAVVACFVMGRLARRGGSALAARLGLLTGVLGVGLVGLSAWQPWWIATVAAALLWFDHADRRSRGDAAGPVPGSRARQPGGLKTG